jgi:hypothetical protein
VCGIGDIELKDLYGRVEFTSRALRERECPTSAGEHNLGSFALRKLCDSKGERRICQHACHHNFLTVKKTHAYDRSSVGVYV